MNVDGVETSTSGRAGAAAHDAGYDSWMTGVSFAHMVQHLSQAHGPAALNSLAVTEHVNRLNLMRTDVAYMALQGPDPEPDRSGTFFVSDFPPEWKTSHLLDGVLLWKPAVWRLIWL